MSPGTRKLCVHCGLTMGHAWPCPFLFPRGASR